MKFKNILILLLVASMLLGCLAGCGKEPQQTEPTQPTADVQPQIPTITPTEPKPTEPEVTGVRAGDIYRINQLATATNGENGVTFYYMDGKTLTPFSQYNAQAGMWYSDNAQLAPCTDAKHNFGQGAGQVIISFDVPATGAVEIHTRTELLSSTGYTVKLAQGTADNTVGSHEITGAAGTDYRYGYSLKVTEGEKLYLIYEPQAGSEKAAFRFSDFVVYTGIGAGAEPTTPVNAPLQQTEQNTQRVINFTDLVGSKNGMNGLTFYYTADGEKLTPLSSYDAAEGKWYQGGDGVLVYPCMVKKDNYGLFGSSAAEYIVMGYKLPATGTINLFAWAALQGDGVDYRVMVAKNSPANIIESFDVKGTAQTVEYRNIELTVKRGDVLYLHYKPLEKVNGAWGGYNTSITYLSGGGDYQVFDPNGIDTGIVSGDSIPFTTLVEEGKNGENGLTWYYTADGATLTPFADYEPNEKKWYYGANGTLIYPSLVPADNYGALGSSASEYVALGYEIDKTGTIDLFTLVSLQSGHDYQLRIAKNDPTKIIYAYNVEGAGGGVASIEKNTLINVNQGDTLYLLYKPLEVQDNAWCGFKVQLNWASVGKHTGPADPEPFVPDETVRPSIPTGQIKVGDSFEFTKLAGQENGQNGLTFYYTPDGKGLSPFTYHMGEGTEFRWYEGSGGLLVYPSFIPADNYGLVGTAMSQYVVMGYEIPETGTVDLFTWMALQSGHDYQVRIAKNDPQKILYTMDVRGDAQTVVHQDTVMNVNKGDILYIIYKPLEPENGAWAGFINRLTYTAVGEHIGPADPEPIQPEDAQQPDAPAEFPAIDDGQIKILTIGNSFTVDTTEYAVRIARSAGVDNFHVGRILIPGSQIDDHYANAVSNAPAYEYNRTTETGGWHITYGYTLAQALMCENWDYIMLQQNSPKSGVPESFSNLEALIAYVQKYTHQDTKIVWNMTWAYQGDSTHDGFAQYGKDQMAMYNAIVSTAQSKLVPNENIAKIISTGSAVQNARTSYMGDTLTEDGYHMKTDKGRYLTALTFVATLLELDPSLVTYKPANVSDLFRDMAIEAVNNARQAPFAITESIYTADKVDTSDEGRRPAQNFTSMANKVNGANGLTFYYTTDGKTLIPYVNYDETEGRWYDNSASQLNMIDPAEVVANNYGMGQCSISKYVAMSYTAPQTGSVDLTTWTGINGPEGIYRYSIRIALGTPDNVVQEYILEGEPGEARDERCTLDVTQGQQIYIIYQLTKNKAAGGWFGYKNAVIYRTGDASQPSEPETDVKVGDSYEFTKLATEENGDNGLTYYYTTDGKELTAFTQHTGEGTEFRWYQGSGGLLVYPKFVPEDNYGLVGNSISQYVVMGFEIPATGTVDLFTWMALQSGHDYQVRIAKNDPQNILYTMDVVGEAQTVVNRNILLNVNKDDTLYIIYKPLNYVNGAWGGFINKLTYTSVGFQTGPADPEPIVPEDPGQPEAPEFADLNDGVMKVLAIGNSFTVDTMEYVSKIAKSAGYEGLQLGKIVIGGSSLDDHYANAVSNAPAYEYGKGTDNGGWTTTYGNTMADILCSENWDYVIIQQHSPGAGDPDSFSNLNGLLDYLTGYLHPDAKIAWNMTWAYQQDTTNESFAQFGNDQMTMYNAIVSTTQSVLVPNARIEKIVSAGTSIQNMRTAYVGDTLTRDGYHLDMGRGRYVAAMAFAKMLLDVDLSKVTYTPAGVSDTFRQATVEAVNNAAAKPFAITASTFTADKVDTSGEVIRDTWNFAEMAGATNGANGLTFYYTTDGKTLTPYVSYDSNQGRWFDNSGSQLNMFDPAEVVKDNYGLGQCSATKNVAMGYTAPETGSVDLFSLTGINGPAGDYRYTVRIAVGSPENVKYEYVLEGRPGQSREERYTLDVKKGEEIYLIYLCTQNQAAGGWFGYKNAITYRTQEETQEPEAPDPGVQVGDQLLSAALAPTGTNGENGMTLYYTADGKNLTPFATYDPNNHGGRWYHIDGTMLSFVDPFVNKGDNYGWIGACQSEYVAMSYDMPASGKVSVTNWLALHTGHDCRILIAQGTPDNVMATYDNVGGVDNVIYETAELTVTKGQKVYVIFQMLEAAANANSCYMGYKTQITYTEVTVEEVPSVNVGDQLLSAALAPTEANGENGMTLYYTADGKNLTPFATYDPHNHGGRWYHIDGTMLSFVDPFVNKGDNYGWIGACQSEYVAMSYDMPASGKVSVTNWLALHTGHDCRILIARGTPDNVVATYDNVGGVDNVIYETAELTVTKGQKVYVIFQMLEAAANANSCYMGYKTQITYTEVSAAPQPEPEQPQHNVKVGDEFKFASLAGDRNGDNGLTFYYTADGKNLSAYSLFDKNMGRWYEVTGGALTWFDPMEVPADNYGQGMTSSAKHVVMGYEVPASGKIDLFLWSALHAGSGYTVSVAQGSLDNVVASYTFTTPNVGVAETYTLDVSAGQTLYFIYQSVTPANNQYFGYNIKITYTEVK